MPAPEGNQFWKLRSKHGRNKLFATPELMWDAACEYFEWCDENPWIKKDFRGKDVKEVEIPTQRPYTIHGLCIYLDVNVQYFNDFEKALTTSDIHKDFSSVITRIREIIYKQKFEGAAVGAFNANIIARDLGLADKQEIKQKIEPVKEVIFEIKTNKKE